MVVIKTVDTMGMTVMMSRRYGADTDTVDDDVWYMLIDSSADAVRVDVMQADQLSTLRYSDSQADFTAVQSSTGQPRHDLLYVLRVFSFMCFTQIHRNF